MIVPSSDIRTEGAKLPICVPHPPSRRPHDPVAVPEVRARHEDGPLRVHRQDVRRREVTRGIDEADRGESDSAALCERGGGQEDGHDRHSQHCETLFHGDPPSAGIARRLNWWLSRAAPALLESRDPFPGLLHVAGGEDPPPAVSVDRSSRTRKGSRPHRRPGPRVGRPGCRRTRA